MSKIGYHWNKGMPPEPDVYVTRRGESIYLTSRYWDGERWFEIAYGTSRGGTPFNWPKRSRVREPKPRYSTKRYDFYLRRIHKDADLIQWGEPYTIYEEREVLAYLVEIGVLPQNWCEVYQENMRVAGFKLRGRKGSSRTPLSWSH